MCLVQSVQMASSRRPLLRRLNTPSVPGHMITPATLPLSRLPLQQPSLDDTHSSDGIDTEINEPNNKKPRTMTPTPEDSSPAAALSRSSSNGSVPPMSSLITPPPPSSSSSSLSSSSSSTRDNNPLDSKSESKDPIHLRSLIPLASWFTRRSINKEDVANSTAKHYDLDTDRWNHIIDSEQIGILTPCWGNAPTIISVAELLAYYELLAIEYWIHKTPSMGNYEKLLAHPILKLEHIHIVEDRRVASKSDNMSRVCTMICEMVKNGDLAVIQFDGEIFQRFPYHMCELARQLSSFRFFIDKEAPMPKVVKKLLTMEQQREPWKVGEVLLQGTRASTIHGKTPGAFPVNNNGTIELHLLGALNGINDLKTPSCCIAYDLKITCHWCKMRCDMRTAIGCESGTIREDDAVDGDMCIETEAKMCNKWFCKHCVEHRDGNRCSCISCLLENESPVFCDECWTKCPDCGQGYGLVCNDKIPHISWCTKHIS